MKSLQIRAGEGVEKREPSYTVVGMQIGVATSENSMEVSLKTKNRATIWFYNPTLGHISGGKHGLNGHMYPSIHLSTVYDSKHMEAI